LEQIDLLKFEKSKPKIVILEREIPARDWSKSGQLTLTNTHFCPLMMVRATVSNIKVSGQRLLFWF